MLDLLVRQRGCRRFLSDPVDPGDLHTILRAATHAPSAENAQPWVFVVVDAPEARQAVADLTRRLWDDVAREPSERNLPAGLFEAVDAFMASSYGGAPTLVVVAGDGRGGASPRLLASSIFPAAQNLLLAAAALGYGSTMTTLAAQAPAELAEVVGLPAGIIPFAVLPIGRPAVPLGPPRRRPVAEVAHRNRFGTPFDG